MHPEHARLLALDGSHAYLSRLLELEAEVRQASSPDVRASLRETYWQVRGNFCRRYPGLTPPPAPSCLRHQ